MKTTKTLQFEIIHANEGKKYKLNNTVRQFRKCVNFYLHEIGKNPELVSNKNLPHIYKKAKKVYNLPMAILQQSGRVAIESYKSYKNLETNKIYPHFDKFLPVRYDKRTATVFKSDGKYKLWLSLSTTQGRVKVPIISSDKVIKEWKNTGYDFLDMRLKYKNKRFFLDVTVQSKSKIPKEEEFEYFIGVDLGINNIATITVMDRKGNQLERKIFSGSLLQEKKRRFMEKRREYGKKKLWNKLKITKNKEQNYVKDINHKISRKIVDIASKYSNSVIVVENLKGIRKKIRYTKKLNRKLHGWSFRQLQDYIEYKAHENGIAIRRVSGAYTSQVCDNCEQKKIVRGSHNVSIGVCENCKKEVNCMDILASVNIIKRLWFYMNQNLGRSESDPNLRKKSEGFTEANQYGFVKQLRKHNFTEKLLSQFRRNLDGGSSYE